MHERPTTIPQLIDKINNAFEELNQDQNLINRAVLGSKSRAELCLQIEGDTLSKCVRDWIKIIMKMTELSYIQ